MADDVHLKIIEGAPYEMVSRGFLRTDMLGIDAVVIARPGTDLAHVGALLIRYQYENGAKIGGGEDDGRLD